MKYYNNIEQIWKEYEGKILKQAPYNPEFRQNLKKIFYDGASALITVIASINKEEAPDSAKDGLLNGVVKEIESFQQKWDEK